MKKKSKIIYNPVAGSKRRILNTNDITLEVIKEITNQYQLNADFYPTKRQKDAIRLASDAKSEGYKLVIAAGGDGTIGEVANGLVGSDIPLGIIPIGTVMNVARMLSIPQDIEKAVELIKIGRVRKIDVGAVITLGGKRLEGEYYFLESAGIGLEAQIQERILELEKGRLKGFSGLLRTFFEFFGYKSIIKIDEVKIETRAPVVTVSNGPYTGAALNISPKAKLNDHKLTVSVFNMSKAELIAYFFKILYLKKAKSKKVEVYQAKHVQIKTRFPRAVHADARIYGITPVEFKIIPNALNVISGFPKKGESALNKRTYLDP